MDSLLERIEENRLDALYLFINEFLRDRHNFDRFIDNLLQVLPHNWSIQRVEVGHEFLSMLQEQSDLFSSICQLEALRTLIISDGYVPRKDNGSVQTNALLENLPKARNLVNLDLQRLSISSQDQLELLTSSLESLEESLEELRLTGLVLPAPLLLDEALETCVEMGNLRSLAISQQPQPSSSYSTSSSALQMIQIQVQQQPQPQGQPQGQDTTSTTKLVTRSIISPECLLNLCKNSTTLQDLALRNMHLDNSTCQTLSKALVKNSFLTSLDIRQNDTISSKGYNAILKALERNYDLWCTVMVDNDSFQAKFNSLIELNQANRGDLVRNPSREKLALFLETVKDPTALWYFWTIHDTILYPLCRFLQWKVQLEIKQQNQQQIIIIKQEQEQEQDQEQEQTQEQEDSKGKNTPQDTGDEEQARQGQKRQVDDNDETVPLQQEGPEDLDTKQHCTKKARVE